MIDFRRFTLLCVLLGSLGCQMMGRDAFGQAPKTEAPKPQSAGKAAADAALKPRPISLKTKDGVDLRAFYFPSDREKEAIPVIVVHEWKGQASPYLKLVLALRDAGCACVALEYRGHGGSRSYVDPRGESKEFNLATMGRADAEAIVAYDLEATKQFLKKENNDGRLNLNALVMVGVQEGCILAATWAVRDWQFPSVGRIKQGQDVKAMVYVSPEKNFFGVAMDVAARDVNLLRLPTLILSGKESPQGKEALRITSRIDAMKKRANRQSTLGLQSELLETNLSGPALLNDVSGAIPKIVTFVTQSVVISETQNPWVLRE